MIQNINVLIGNGCKSSWIFFTLLLSIASLDAFGGDGFTIRYQWTIRKLPETEAKQLDDAIIQLIDATESDIFLSISSLTNVVKAIFDVNNTLIELKNKKHARFTRDVYENYRLKLNLLDFYIHDWTLVLGREMYQEIAQLNSMMNHDDIDMRQQAHAQLHAIQELITTSSETMVDLVLPWRDCYKKFATEFADGFQDVHKIFIFIDEHLQNLEDVLLTSNKSIYDILEPIKHIRPRIVSYGSPEWQALTWQRPPTPKSWLDQKIDFLCKYLNPLGYIPEPWRPSSTFLWRAFFASLLAGQVLQAILLQSSDIDLLLRDEDYLQDSKQIDREVALLGTILFDKYQLLSEEQHLEKLTANFQHLLPTLRAVHERFQGKPISKAEIFDILDNYRATRTQ